MKKKTLRRRRAARITKMPGDSEEVKNLKISDFFVVVLPSLGISNTSTETLLLTVLESRYLQVKRG